MTDKDELRVPDYLDHMHGYFSVDLEVVWQTIQDNLPGLEQRIKELRASL